MESQSSILYVSRYTQEGLPILGRVFWYEGEGHDTKETCSNDLKKAPLGEEGRTLSLVEPEVFGFRRGVRTNEMDLAEKQASKEATHPPSFIECLVGQVQDFSFSDYIVDCDIPSSSDNSPSV